VLGHEIVGRIVRIGGEVRGLGEGDRVGVGWQCGACFACDACLRGRVHQCSRAKARTCVGRPGGLATRVRVDSRFCFAIPSAIEDAYAAPLLCAGVTVFSALARHARAGMRVGIIGLGGLGHLAVQFARAMGTDVTAFDPDPRKREDALALGAKELVSTSDDALIGHRDAFDVLLSTTPAELAWDRWMYTLDLGGTLCLVGIPTGRVAVHPDHLLDGEKSITGSIVGSPQVMRRMLAFAESHDIRPRIERFGMRQVNDAIGRLRAGEARYRIVLDNDLAR
jgi:uncharacterized zinc-type alcohol dehydrogenase-like protein